MQRESQRFALWVSLPQAPACSPPFGRKVGPGFVAHFAEATKAKKTTPGKQRPAVTPYLNPQSIRSPRFSVAIWITEFESENVWRAANRGLGLAASMRFSSRFISKIQPRSYFILS